jgi:hypothetical protein
MANNEALQNQTGEYDQLASEYYDALLHPTCANFRALSYGFIREAVHAIGRNFSTSLEIGAGKSLLAELRQDGMDCFGELTISDKHANMLAHSDRLQQYFNHRTIVDMSVASVNEMLLENFELVVGSLIDPYNGSPLWANLKEITFKGGYVIVTTPSYDWAQQFRNSSDAKYDFAEFASGDQRISVRSVVLEPKDQIALAERCGFKLVQLKQKFCSELLPEQLSPKLKYVLTHQLPAVTGYVFVSS